MLHGHTGGVVAVTKAAERIISAGWDRKVCVFNCYTWERDEWLDCCEDFPSCVSSSVASFDDTSTRVELLVGFRNGAIRVWTLGINGIETHFVKLKRHVTAAHTDMITSLQCVRIPTRPNCCVVSTSLDCWIHLWCSKSWNLDLVDSLWRENCLLVNRHDRQSLEHT